MDSKCQNTFNEAKDQLKKIIKDNKLNKDDAYAYCENGSNAYTSEFNCTQKQVDDFCKDVSGGGGGGGSGGGSSSMWIWILIVVLVILVLGAIMWKSKHSKRSSYGGYHTAPDSLSGW
jgi:hypothetical protein